MYETSAFAIVYLLGQDVCSILDVLGIVFVSAFFLVFLNPCDGNCLPCSVTKKDQGRLVFFSEQMQRS